MGDEAFARIDGVAHSYCGGLIRRLCPDCKQPNDTEGLLRCQRCDKRAKREAIPLRDYSDAFLFREVPKDTGCSYAPSCLECPFEHCRYDGGRGLRDLFTSDQRKQVVALTREGVCKRDIAERLGISLRTVHRALKAEAARPASAVIT